MFNETALGGFISEVSVRDEFSNSSDYALEIVPKGMNNWQRKKWLDQKLNLIGSQRAQVFINKSKIIWSFLEDGQKYWLPFEKVQFYLDVLDIKNNTIIVEQDGDSENYYAIVDKFLVFYGKEKNGAIDAVFQHGTSKEFELIGVGNVKEHCSKLFSFNEIAQKIRFSNQDVSEDDMIYLNESGDLYEGINEIKTGAKMVAKSLQSRADELFYYWFEHGRTKFGYKKFRLSVILSAGFIFFALGFYFGCQKDAANMQISNLIQKCEKILK